MTCRPMSEAQVNEAFLAGAPLIGASIHDLSVQAPNWYSELYDVQPWPDGAGTVMEEFIFRSALPPIEEGFDNWALQDNNSGIDPCSGPNCSYNWTTLGGHAMERRMTRLMSRDFRSNPYCVKKIQTSYQYQKVFTKIVEGLHRQIRFHKEINIGQNMLTGIAKKIVVDSGGIKYNTENPYIYRPKGTATLSTLTVGILEHIYELLRVMPETVPYDVVNGAPLYALSASPQLLARLFQDDPSLRQDARFSSNADNLLLKYNFQNTLRGMFFQVPFLWPRRFRYDSGNSRWIRVYPFVNGIPAEAGSFSDINPQYVDPSYATHEEVLIHGKSPFTVFYQPTVTSLGEGSDFGPEPGFFDTWNWSNPETKDDPARREGYFWTSGSIGLSAQFSQGVFGLMVPRPPVGLMTAFYPNPLTPPTAASVTNVVPDVDCPVSPILTVRQSLVDATKYEIVFASAQGLEANDTIDLGVSTGGYVTATVVTANADGSAVTATLSAVPACLDNFTSVFVDDTRGCSSRVVKYNINSADATRIDVYLHNPIKADASETVTVYYGNGSSVSATVISRDMTTGKYVVDIGGSNFSDTVGGVVAVCVPTATDATCGACQASPAAVETACS